MILYYFPIAQNTVNKTVIFFFRFMNVHIFYYLTIYWSDTSLVLSPDSLCKQFGPVLILKEKMHLKLSSAEVVCCQ